MIQDRVAKLVPYHAAEGPPLPLPAKTKAK
jgi:hypothetical protein